METKVKALSLVIAVTLVSVLGHQAGADEGVVTEAQLRWSRAGAERAGELVDGTMRAVATREGVKVTVVTNELTPGHSYTMWVEYFNNPEFCVMPPGDHYRCGFVDLGVNGLVDASVAYGDGIPMASGVDDRFEAFIPAASLPTTIPGFIRYGTSRLKNTGFPIGGLFKEKSLTWIGLGLLSNPLGAEYQVMVLDHGPYDPERFGEAQWTMHGGGCHLEEGTVWPYLAGKCAMAQAAGWPAFPPMTLGSEIENIL